MKAIARVWEFDIYLTKGEFWVQEYTSDNLPKAPDYCKHFKTLNGALMWCARQ